MVYHRWLVQSISLLANRADFLERPLYSGNKNNNWGDFGMGSLKYFSMFSGIGGLELGILRAYRKENGRVQTNTQGKYEKGQRLESTPRQKACTQNRRYGEQFNSNPDGGATCIGFSEIDKYAIQIYKKHFNHKEYGDVSKIKWNDVEDFDLLSGGFPCQAFSIAGKRKGFYDTRGTLFFEIARAAQEKQPRLLLLENVKGLLSHDKGRTFGVILNTLDELGYDLQWQVLNSKNFGVPQNRERVFIVGHLRGTSRPEVFPIGEIPEMDNRKKSGLQIASALRQTDYKGTHNLIQYGNSQDHKISTSISQILNAGHYNQPKTIDNCKIRRLTPTECERLQSFPDGWTERGLQTVSNKYRCFKCEGKGNSQHGLYCREISDTQRYKCLGNAVTVNVIEAIMKRLMVFLLFFFLFTVNAYAGEYSNNEIANAIYKTENSKRFPYGIVSINTRGNEAYARRICLNSISNNRKRWIKAGKPEDFIFFMGRRYCPPNSKNWARLVKYFLEK